MKIWFQNKRSKYKKSGKGSKSTGEKSNKTAKTSENKRQQCDVDNACSNDDSGDEFNEDDDDNDDDDDDGDDDETTEGDSSSSYSTNGNFSAKNENVLNKVECKNNFVHAMQVQQEADYIRNRLANTNENYVLDSTAQTHVTESYMSSSNQQQQNYPFMQTANQVFMQVSPIQLSSTTSSSSSPPPSLSSIHHPNYVHQQNLLLQNNSTPPFTPVLSHTTPTPPNNPNWMFTTAHYNSHSPLHHQVIVPGMQ